jgi:hypothetical protein
LEWSLRVNGALLNGASLSKGGKSNNGSGVLHFEIGDELLGKY